MLFIMDMAKRGKSPAVGDVVANVDPVHVGGLAMGWHSLIARGKSPHI